MIAYHCDYKAILVAPYKLHKDSHRLLAYNEIMTWLKKRNQLVDLKILDNEDSAEYKTTMQDIWKVDYQLVLPNIHRHNPAERAISTFKAHFLSILAYIADDFPKNMLDLLITQTEMTLNLLRQSTLNTATSEWAHLNGPISYNHAPVGPLGWKVIIHQKTNARPSWYFRGKDGWNVGMSLEHYWCQLIVAKDTKAVQVSDTVEFCHHYRTRPTLTHTDRILHGMNNLYCALKDLHSLVIHS